VQSVNIKRINNFDKFKILFSTNPAQLDLAFELAYELLTFFVEDILIVEACPPVPIKTVRHLILSIQHLYFSLRMLRHRLRRLHHHLRHQLHQSEP
jgi:hypothetical protein